MGEICRLITNREMFCTVLGALEILEIPPHFKNIIKTEFCKNLGLEPDEISKIERELDQTLDYLLSNIRKRKQEGEGV